MLKKFTRNCCLIVLIQILSSTSCKPNNTQRALVCAEVGCAVASMFADIGGHAAAVQNKKGIYEPFYIIRDVLSIANKALYFYGYSQYGRDEIHPYNREKYYLYDRRDLLAQGAFLVQDIINIYKNVSSLKQKRSEEKHEEVVRLIIDPSSTILPLLKGITAIALSYSKLDQSCIEKQYALAATQALTRLVDEYRELEEESSYKKPLVVLIIINAIWLLYELKGYRDKASTFGRCPLRNNLCTGDLEGYSYLTRLECGHAFCRGCLFRRAIGQQPLGRAQCPQNGCEHRLTEVEYDGEDFAERRNDLRNRDAHTD